MRFQKFFALSLTILTLCLIGHVTHHNAFGTREFKLDASDFMDQPTDVEFEPNQLLVGYKANRETNWQVVEEIKNRFQLRLISRYDYRNLELLSFPNQADMSRIIKAFDRANVRFAEPNYIYRPLATTPNDSRYRLQWGLEAIDAPGAWDKITGGNVVIAIVDQASDWTHEDLIDNLWVNSGEDLNGNGILDKDDLNNRDDDRNGYIDDVLGYNFATGTPIVYDGRGDFHGTHVSGIMGASGNNLKGVSGVMWNVKIMRAPFISGMSGNTYSAVESIDYAVANHADVINNSWGGKGYSQALKEAVKGTEDAGIVFVVAAGNDGKNNDRIPVYPASFDFSNLIAVAATTERGMLATFSNYGAKSVHVAAPGDHIYSTFVNNGYMYLSGTSMASPMVSGAVGLMLARNPKLSPSQIRTILMTTCDPLVAMSGRVACNGEINLNRAIECIDRGGKCN
jgi:subtilisin family serine protease